MRILLLTPFLPHPEATAGAPRTVYHRLSLLQKEHQVTVATFLERGEEARLAQLHAAGISVYVVRRQSARRGGRGALWRKRLRLALGLFTDSRPMLVQEFGSTRMRRLVERLTRQRRFDLVLVEHILSAQFAHYPHRSETPVIISEHDAPAAFRGSATGAERRWAWLLRPLLLLDRAKWRLYARRAYRGASLVLAPTAEDALVIREQAPRTRVEVVPFGVVSHQPLRSGISDGQPEESREGGSILFVGNFDHPPNRDAAVWLGREIMPLVWSRRPACLWLVGKHPTADVKALASERVVVTGEVPSAAEYLARCTLFVAPLRSGGGMRVKLLEALAAGAPIVTTTLGAQGLGACPGTHLLVADDAGGIASAIVAALDDPGLRARLGSAGRQLARQLAAGDTEAQARRLYDLLSSVVAYEQVTGHLSSLDEGAPPAGDAQ